MAQVLNSISLRTVGEAMRALEAARAQSLNIMAEREAAGLDPCSAAHREALVHIDRLIAELSN